MDVLPSLEASHWSAHQASREWQIFHSTSMPSGSTYLKVVKRSMYPNIRARLSTLLSQDTTYNITSRTPHTAMLRGITILTAPLFVPPLAIRARNLLIRIHLFGTAERCQCATSIDFAELGTPRRYELGKSEREITRLAGVVWSLFLAHFQYGGYSPPDD